MSRVLVFDERFDGGKKTVPDTADRDKAVERAYRDAGLPVPYPRNSVHTAVLADADGGRRR